MNRPKWLTLPQKTPQWVLKISKIIEMYAVNFFGKTTDLADNAALLEIHRIVEKNDLKALKILLAKEHVSFDIPNDKGDTPLFIAAAKGFIEIGEFLIAQKVQIDVINILGKSPLCIAAENGQNGFMQILIQAGANIHITDKDLNNLLQLSVIAEQHQSLIFLLEYPDIAINHTNRFGQTPLILATEKNLSESVKALIAKGASLNLSDHDGWSPLMYAVKKGTEDLVSIFIANNADLQTHDLEFKQTPYLIACRAGQISSMKILLKHGAKSDDRDYYNRTALHIAVEINNLEMVRFVIDQNPDLLAKDRFGLTALEWAIVNASADIVKAIRDAYKK